jgi:hypothetical protein
MHSGLPGVEHSHQPCSLVLLLPDLAGATTVALSSSPVLASGDSGMLVRMRAVLHRHQCGSEQEAVSVCMRSARSAGQPPVAGTSCERYINALRYCEHATQHHNYPSFANAMMY